MGQTAPRVATFALRENLPPRSARAREQAGGKGTGTFYLQNVYESWPELPAGDETGSSICGSFKSCRRRRRMRIIRKSAKPTPRKASRRYRSKRMDRPTSSPREDPDPFSKRSAGPRADHAKPDLLAARRAGQCVGCRKRTQAFSAGGPGAQLNGALRPISRAWTGRLESDELPDPHRPVLDRLCVSYLKSRQAGRRRLAATAAPENQFSQSYNRPHQAGRMHTAWGMPNGNLEPLTAGVFDARQLAGEDAGARARRRRPQRRLGTDQHPGSTRMPCSTVHSTPPIRPASSAGGGSRAHRRIDGKTEKMRYRKIGSTQIEASVIGFGTWGIGGWMWGGVREADSIRHPRRAGNTAST